MIGAWRSLVAHLHGVQGVGGSNPLAPIVHPYGASPGSPSTGQTCRIYVWELTGHFLVSF
jgi:hypothetical protein